MSRRGRFYLGWLLLCAHALTGVLATAAHRHFHAGAACGHSSHEVDCHRACDLPAGRFEISGTTFESTLESTAPCPVCHYFHQQVVTAWHTGWSTPTFLVGVLSLGTRPAVVLADRMLPPVRGPPSSLV